MFRLAFVLGFAAAALFAQVETARVTGTVSDPAGARVPQARITLTHLATSQKTEVRADAEGRYLSLPLRIGEYRIEAQAEGFKRAVRNGIVLQIQETAVIDFPLELGATSETVSVTAEAPLLATTDASQGQVIDNRRIVNLPLNGRDYIQLALISSGTAPPLNGSRTGGFSTGGQRTAQNNFLLDGIDNNNVQLATQGGRAEAVKPSVDAIQEFKISTNSYSAEFGRATGGVVNATIKSGTNDIHGTVFEFLRNDKLDAKNFFDPPNQPRAPFKRNQFGFSAGGPVIRNKTFVFGDYEWTRIRESRTVNATLPTVAQRTGDFTGIANIFDPATYDAAARTRQPFAGNRIPDSRIDRVARQASGWYPTPTNARTTQNFVWNPPNNENWDKWDVRVDHNFTPSDLVYFRFSAQKNFEPSAPDLPATQFSPNGSDVYNNGRNMALVWNHIFSPSVVTSTRLGWNRLFTDERPAAEQNANALIGLRGVDQSTPGSPRFNINSYNALGIGANLPNTNDSQTRQLINDTSWIRGRHTVKFGGNLNWLQAFITNPKEGLGVFVFNGNYSRNSLNNQGGNPFADFLLGIPFQASIANPVYANLRAPFYHAYIQDEWRVTNKLTLSIGLRYELNKHWVETRNLIANYDMDANIGAPELIPARDGSRLNRALMKTDPNNFAPRFGFAYSATKNTVVRGGYGLFYGNYEGTGGGRHMLGNPPATISVQISTDSIRPAFVLQDGVPAGSLDPRNLTNLRLTSFETAPAWPYAQQWNLNIQRQLTQNLVWEVGYYAAKTVHLPTRWNGNYALPGAGNINARRRYQQITYPGTNFRVSPLSLVDRHDYFGNSQYHSFQTRLEKRFSAGFSVLGSYTFGKAIGDTGGFSASGSPPGTPQGFQNPLNRRLEKSRDDQDQRHRLVTTYQWELPFGKGRRFGAGMSGVANAVAGGWAVGGITTFSSGLPMGLSLQGDPANTGDPNRPNVVGDWRLDRGARSLDRFFNTSAFAPNAPFTYGNAARNLMEQPGLVNTDFAAFKEFALREKLDLQFRFEAFNFFNTPNFGAPNSQLGNINFGRVTSASRPRNLQFGLKLVF